MSPKKRLPYFEQHSEPIEARIATGLHKIGLALKQQDWQQANQAGLSPTQGQILGLLVGEGPLTGSELSQRLGVTLPTISESVKVLVAKQLVVKKPDPRHPRASLLEPTKQGAVLGTTARAWPEFLAEAVGELNANEQQAFFAGVVKMIRGLQERGQVPLSGMCVTCTQFRPHVHKGKAPHHCALVDAPLAAAQLRIDCPEHERAEPAQREAVWARFCADA
ncbi:MAG: winged helix-turn-helix transcriptional regulator [Polyangiaceae bacterium]|nr:winged helix-turn-helix transcriptional regulator [Polyangiaceae bacterium]MCB9610017.1 winged helix-turn-helix transcriptional regulator [Polyangiaceae bacterium]